jgi:hypothetical protein
VARSNCLATFHPEIAAQWHPVKNGNLTPYDVTAGSKKSVWWKCPKADDHEWPTTVNNRTNSAGQHGCPFCSGGRVVLSTCLATVHPGIAALWHPTKNGNLTPFDITQASLKRVWWKCPKADDHEWAAPPAYLPKHSKNSGCPCCRGLKVVPSNCLATTHPNITAQWHNEKNGNLTPNDVTAGSGKSVWWKCSKADDHEWPASVSNRTGKQHTGCPICDASKGEIAVSSYLVSKGIPFEPQWAPTGAGLPNRYKFDFRPQRGEQFCVIEYHGEQHYLPVSFGSKKPQAKINSLRRIVRRDFTKENWCKHKDVVLLVIPYWDYGRIGEILDDFFAAKTPTFSEPPEIVRKYQPVRQMICAKMENTRRTPRG